MKAGNSISTVINMIKFSTKIVLLGGGTSGVMKTLTVLPLKPYIIKVISTLSQPNIRKWFGVEGTRSSVQNACMQSNSKRGIFYV